MKNRLTKNWGLKLGSFIFAAALWIIVTNINDPVTSLKVSDVPVTIKNAELITDNGQIYEVLDGTDVIDLVTITAARSIIDSLDESNVVAVADMNDLTSLDTISIRLSTNKYNDKLESISGSIDCVRLNIEDKKTKSLPIRINTVGEVKDGYLVGDVSTEQNLIRISGPESVISQITKAQVEIDVSGFTSNIGTDIEIRFYNDEGEEVVSDSIEKSISKVRVSVEILERKTVPVNYEITGMPADGYSLNGEIESTRTMVTIAGKSKVIENVNSIDVPEGVIDVTGAKDDVTTLVDLKDYLPDGTELAEDNFSGKVNVTVGIEQNVEKQFIIPVTDIEIRNMPEGYEGEITDPAEECVIVLMGLSADLQNITVTDIAPYIDVAEWMTSEEMEELSRGTYRVTLDISLPESTISVKEAVEVALHIIEKE